jgi:WD40 repeat protein
VVITIPENQPDTTIADLAFTPDGQQLIYAVNPGKFVLRDIASDGAESTLWEGDTSAPSIAVSPDGKWVALKTADHAEIWDAVNRELVAEIPSEFRPQFSTDSGRILVYHDMQFVVHETGTWIELIRFGIPCDCIYTLSPDFSLFATSEQPAPEAEGAPVLIWDVATGKQIQSLEGGKGFTAFLLFTPDGEMLWRAGQRGDLMAWDTNSWQLLAENIGGITPISNLRRFQFVEDGRHYLLQSDLLLGLYGLP